MGLFGKRTPPPPPLAPRGPSITEADREWVERAFKFIISVFGKPTADVIQIDFSEHYFPETFKGKEIEVSNLIFDLSNYLSLDTKKITFEFGKDIRDISQTPHQVYKSFRSELEIINDNKAHKRYCLHIANSLNENPDILVIRTIVELLKVKFAENNFSFTIEDESNLLIYLVGIYFGFGYILASKLYDIRVQYKAGWKSTSRFDSGVSPQLMAYALAFFANIQNNEYTNLPENFTQQIREEFDLSMEYLSNFDFESFLKEEKPDNEFIADEISKHASQLYRDNEYEKAIEELLKALPHIEDSNKLARNYCNLGYYSLRLKHYNESIPYFIKSLEYKTDYPYSLDNLGFAYLMVGKLDEGKENIEKAMATGNDDKAYSLRNLGIYHMKKNDFEQAEEYFQKAFDMNKKVDLLEYFYAQFLFYKGDKKGGMNYLEMAVAKGEPEAIELIEELADSSPSE